MKRKYLIIFLAGATLLGLGYLFARSSDEKISLKSPAASIQQPALDISKNAVAEDKTASQSAVQNQTALKVTIDKKIEIAVPFTVQAPFGNWSDPIFQNACEESSIVMAIGWLDNVIFILPSEAQKQILKIVDYENKTFGYNADTDVFQMQKIFQDFFQVGNVSIKENMTIDDIKAELQKDNLVLVPAFGQALGNPNYTPPGPIAHMLAIVGYDPATKEFITNDPGTKHGAGHRYDEQVLFGAVWAYPKGKDVPLIPNPSKMGKVMIVIAK